MAKIAIVERDPGPGNVSALQIVLEQHYHEVSDTQKPDLIVYEDRERNGLPVHDLKTLTRYDVPVIILSNRQDWNRLLPRKSVVFRRTAEDEGKNQPTTVKALETMCNFPPAMLTVDYSCVVWQ